MGCSIMGAFFQTKLACNEVMGNVNDITIFLKYVNELPLSLRYELHVSGICRP